MTPPVDHLLGRAPADSELQPSASDEVGGARILDHVEGILVAHVDDRRADFDTASPGDHGRQQRKRRSKLAGEVVDAEIGPICAQLLRRDGQVNGL